MVRLVGCFPESLIQLSEWGDRTNVVTLMELTSCSLSAGKEYQLNWWAAAGSGGT